MRVAQALTIWHTGPETKTSVHLACMGVQATYISQGFRDLSAAHLLDNPPQDTLLVVARAQRRLAASTTPSPYARTRGAPAAPASPEQPPPSHLSRAGTPAPAPAPGTVRIGALVSAVAAACPAPLRCDALHGSAVRVVCVVATAAATAAVVVIVVVNLGVGYPGARGEAMGGQGWGRGGRSQARAWVTAAGRNNWRRVCRD